jgi:predicted DNA-binding ribbon-helix-helix protein
LHEIALNKGVSTTALIERIDTNRAVHNLSSAIRLFVLDYFKNVRQSARSTDNLPVSPVCSGRRPGELRKR